MSTQKNVVDQVEVVASVAEKKPRGRKPKSLDVKPDAVDANPNIVDVEPGVVDVKPDVVEKKPRQKKVKASLGEESKVDPGVDVETKEKKPKKPTLSAKFSKFIHFGLFLMKELNEQRLLDGESPLIDETIMLDKLTVFADVELQTAFVQKFFEESKDIAKNMRKIILDKKKSLLLASKAANKKPRTKKNITSSNDQAQSGDLVAQLVSLANTPLDSTKPKRPYTRKPKNSSSTLNETPLDLELELEVDLVSIHGVQYLKDDRQRLFHPTSHSLLAHLLPDGSVQTL